MLWSIALLLALSNISSAQDSAVTLYINGFGDVAQNGSLALSPAASIRHHYPSTTEMLLSCATSIPKKECVLGDGINYTIISDNTYLGSWSTSELDMFMHFTCIHNMRASNVACQEEKQNQLGYYTSNMVYAAVSEDFVTMTVQGGAEKLRITEQALSAPTPATSRITSSGPSPTASVPNTTSMSTGGAERHIQTTYVLLGLTGATLYQMW